MRRAIVVLAVCLYAAMGLFAQSQVVPQDATHVVIKDVSLTAAGQAVTIQLPTSNAKVTKIVAVDVFCSVACDFTFERDGTAATATSSTPVKLTASTPAATTQGFVDSDAGSGTVIYRGNVNNYARGYGREILPTLTPSSSSQANFTVRVGSITGRATINIYFRQEKN